MKSIARIDIPRTINDLVHINYGASLVYPVGPPRAIEPPNWAADEENEMDVCQREFFLKNCSDVADILLDDILYYHDCIGFMHEEESASWIPVWMCGSFYAVDVLSQASHLVTHYAQSFLERSLVAGRVPVSIKAVEYFAAHVCGTSQAEPDLYAKIEAFQKREHERARDQ